MKADFPFLRSLPWKCQSRRRLGGWNGNSKGWVMTVSQAEKDPHFKTISNWFYNKDGLVGGSLYWNKAAYLGSSV